jgi:hypothetical protein
MRTVNIVVGGYLLLTQLSSANAASQQPLQPWEEPQDTLQALMNSDQYAWQLFVALNWPADLNNRNANPNKKFGDDGPVVWETWRNTRFTAEDSVFREDGSDPGSWLEGAKTVTARSSNDFIPTPLKLAAALAAMTDPRPSTVTRFDRPTVTSGEVRMNKAAYEYVRTNGLYNQDGIKALIKQGVRDLSFPLGAKEIKAEWKMIKDSDKPRYHWTEFHRNGKAEIWGLTALHISTKDLPRWFWATFEHIDNQQAQPAGAPETANLGWQTESVDKFACAKPPYNCNLAPTGIGLEGTKWENYRLRGTQLDFVDNTGLPTILGNSQIEGIFHTKSSCVTCHARATKDINFAHLNFASFEVGTPNRDDFLDPTTQKPRYMQLDFVWSFLMARPKAGQ